ncbi:ABC transporter substrate binding protein [Fundidesulfovibrio agrisoli]|uniref:ABC transporter substrate binding protein n=1 Tax=Fundidesulfovibrio agrisoli TaxID=2922717 RepID=UPI001FAD504B|nr:ABC transporter substrate binding protein [Fundidesulfovibrio agrisoli]
MFVSIMNHQGPCMIASLSRILRLAALAVVLALLAAQGRAPAQAQTQAQPQNPEPPTSQAFPSSQERRQVLVLHSYHKGLAWTDSEDAGIDSVLEGKPGLEVFTEYMDAKRYAQPADSERLASYYARKYANARFDVIVATDDDAFQFLLARRDTLFPGAQVVFCGVNYFDESMIAHSAGAYTGVVEAYDVRSTLRAALALHPGTYRLVVINDRTPTGQANRKILADVLPEFEKKVSVVYLDDLTTDELLAKVRSLATGDIVLLMTFNRDKAGRVMGYNESISLVAGQSKVPVYGVWDFYLGRGLTGGMITNGLDQGRLAAQMALRILAGERAGSIPVVKESTNRFMFDYAQLKRFGISPDTLPEGSTVINRPTSFYEEHSGKVLSVGVAFLLMSGMLVALWVNIQRRKRTEASLRESEEKFEKIFRHSPDWIAIMRLSDGTYLDVNDAFEKITGFTRDEVLGKTALDIGIYSNPKERYELDEAFLRMGRTQIQELQYRLKSGEVITVERAGELVEIGGERCIISIVRDITSKKQAEQALIETEKQKKLRADAEIKMLQAQINPHFLFNAITSIMYYIRTDPEVAYNLLVKLGDFFRKNIKPGGASVPLSKEIDHCEDYLSIERARFEERLRVSYDIHPAALDCPVPPLILQPLVENALRHGIMPKEEGGEIVIGAHPEDGVIRIFVRDDGVGMDAATVASLLDESGGAPPRKGTGLALRNVNARLVAIHGAQHGLKIESEPGKGTTISFTIPAMVTAAPQ